MKVRAVIDRIEEKLAVLEVAGKGEVTWPVALLPQGIRPGNILDMEISLNPQAEEAQRKKIKNLQQKLKDR